MKCVVSFPNFSQTISSIGNIGQYLRNIYTTPGQCVSCCPHYCATVCRYVQICRYIQSRGRRHTFKQDLPGRRFFTKTCSVQISSIDSCEASQSPDIDNKQWISTHIYTVAHEIHIYTQRTWQISLKESENPHCPHLPTSMKVFVIVQKYFPMNASVR